MIMDKEGTVMIFERAATKYPITVNERGCWEWNGRRNHKGYGLVDFYGEEWLSHRLFYFLEHRALPSDLVIDHLCKIRACCNPAHLQAVTSKENTRRGESVPGINARKSACVRGHEFDESNTIIRKDGRRRCKICTQAATLEYLRKRRANST